MCGETCTHGSEGWGTSDGSLLPGELIETITQLSDDDVRIDEAEQLLLAVERADVITQKEAFDVLNHYLDETIASARFSGCASLPD